MKQIEGGICAVRGGVSANGIKVGKMGLTVILAEGPAAGVFTKNKVAAAPVHPEQRSYRDPAPSSAIVANMRKRNAIRLE